MPGSKGSGPSPSPDVGKACAHLLVIFNLDARCLSSCPVLLGRVSCGHGSSRRACLPARAQDALFIHDAVYAHQAREALSIHAWYVAKELGGAFAEGREAAAAVLATKAEPHRQRNVELYEGLPQVLPRQSPSQLCRSRACLLPDAGRACPHAPDAGTLGDEGADGTYVLSSVVTREALNTCSVEGAVMRRSGAGEGPHLMFCLPGVWGGNHYYIMPVPAESQSVRDRQARHARRRRPEHAAPQRPRSRA